MNIIELCWLYVRCIDLFVLNLKLTYLLERKIGEALSILRECHLVVVYPIIKYNILTLR
jgi:hypothetical protein